MAATRIRVEGAAELSKSLKAAGAELGEMKALHKRVGETLAEGARPLAPHASGALEATIKASALKAGGAVRAGSSSVPYAGVQEFGWPARNIPPQPYLTASLAAQEPKIIDLYDAELDRILGKVHGA